MDPEWKIKLERLMDTAPTITCAQEMNYIKHGCDCFTFY